MKKTTKAKQTSSFIWSMHENPFRVHEWHEALPWSRSRYDDLAFKQICSSHMKTARIWEPNFPFTNPLILTICRCIGLENWNAFMALADVVISSLQTTSENRWIERRLLFARKFFILYPVGSQGCVASLMQASRPFWIWNKHCKANLLWCAHQRTLAWGLSKLVNWH